MDRNRILKSYYGFDTFKEGQAEVIDSIMAGRDVMCIMPTGAGKSVCYQIPALMQSGTTLVVSPLISLMKDQVSALSQMDIKAAYINSSMTSQEYGRTLSAMSRGIYRIVYVAPERLHSETFAEICRKIDIPFIAVDEAHCISQWGQDFRPSYLRIAEFVRNLPGRPVIGAARAGRPVLHNDQLRQAESVIHSDTPRQQRAAAPEDPCKAQGADRHNLLHEAKRR